MRFERPLVHQQRVERAVQAVLIDLRLVELQQFGKRRAPVRWYRILSYALVKYLKGRQLHPPRRLQHA
jgi:hypothetical protein